MSDGPIPVTEQRFRDGTGEQYTADGRIRCQALSKGRIRRWREEFDDYTTPSEDLWPECQCNRSAEYGAFACKWHGGLTPKKSAPPRSVIDVLPSELAVKMHALIQDPQYLSRHSDIALMQTRVWELLEELQEVSGSEESWGNVTEALVSIKRGNDAEALLFLEKALEDNNRKKEIWEEIRKTELVVKELTNTQVKTAKELRQMATTEQVMSVVLSLYDIVATGAKKYIHDSSDRATFLNELGRAVQRYVNIGPATISPQIEPGRLELDGNAE